MPPSRQGYGAALDLRSCVRCPVGWVSKGGRLIDAQCRPCPQLSTSNPLRTACVARPNVARPNLPEQLCAACPDPTAPFDPPVCCPKGTVCCGNDGCCDLNSCINNATTGNQPTCCGVSCPGIQTKQLGCCNTGQVCLNSSTATTGTQICCDPSSVCKTSSSATSGQCCLAGQACCAGSCCLNTQSCIGDTASTAVVSRCCDAATQSNCNSACCNTEGSNPSQTCLTQRNGVRVCCNNDKLCPPSGAGTPTTCCGTSFCAFNSSVAELGLQSACCTSSTQVLCPKRNGVPICCLAGRCPPIDQQDSNCLV